MNQVENTLSEICNTHRLREKIFIVPSFSQGHQITESLVKNGIPYINLRIKTLTSSAHETIDLDLAKESINLLSETSTLIIIEDLFNQLREKRDSYFHNLEPKEGIVSAIANALRELRMSGISAEGLSPKHFVNEKKGSEIRELFERYEAFLKEKKYADYPDMLRRAIEKLQKGKNDPDDKLYLILSDKTYHPLEKEFLNALPGEKIILPHDTVYGIVYPRRYLDPSPNPEVIKPASKIERLSWLFSPEDAPGKFDDKTVTIFHAVGKRNELREVLRRIVNSDIKCDEAEIIYSSYDEYVPMLYDLAKKFDIIITIEEGLPISVTRPGRAALGFLSWIVSNYEAVRFRQLITGGSLDIKPDGQADDQISPSVMARIIRESPIGWGKERYIPSLEKMAEYYLKKSSELTEEGESLREFYMRKEANARFLIKMLKPVLASIPVEDEQGMISLKDLCFSMLSFVTDYARVSNEMDGEAKAAIKERIEEIAAMSTKAVPLEDAINEIELILRGIRVGQSGPAPGCLHVSSYQNGGRSGRHHTFIVGCDAQTFPGTLIQNPILLDEEMQAISENLILSSDLLKEKLYRISSLLASQRGKITFSFSSFDVLENRESFPSSILLQVFRLTSGDINANYTDFMKALGLPSGYIPSGQHLDTSDFWITSFISEQGLKLPDSSVFLCYPRLLQGMKAREARETDQVTEYDGLLHAPDRERDPRENMSMVVSASSLEKFANCPYAYFLNYVLKVKPLEEIAFEADTWLDGMQRGSLLHEVFNRFMKKITGKNEKPSVQKHIPLIESLLEEVITEFREELPPPSEAIFEQEKKILRKATQVFLKTEENRCKKYTPVFFELAFGYEDAEGEIKEPIKIPVGSGKSFNAAGRIDRIDEIAEGEYAVMDYKTGSAYRYNEKNVFNKGKTIQHALYAIAAERILQKLLKDNKVKVSQSGYLFPTEKETGRQIVYARHDKEFIQLLTVIFDAVKAGIFIPADDKESCTYCKYTNICGSGITVNTKLKLNNTENSEIELVRQLKNYD